MRTGAAIPTALLLACAAGLAAATCSDGYSEIVELERERGETALSLGNADDAEEAFRSALDYHPSDARSLHGLARALLAKGDPEAALAALTRLRRSQPGYFEAAARDDYSAALLLAADSRLEQGDPGGALDTLRRLERADPDNPGLAELRERAMEDLRGRLRRTSHSDESAVLLREALDAEPPRLDLVAELAERLIRRERVDTAISVLSDALLRHPEDPRLQALMDRALDIRYPNAPWGPASRRADPSG